MTSPDKWRRRVVREGFEADAVMIGFQNRQIGSSHDSEVPAAWYPTVRWLTAAGKTGESCADSSYAGDPRCLGDLMRVMVDPLYPEVEGDDLPGAVVIAEPASASNLGDMAKSKLSMSDFTIMGLVRLVRVSQEPLPPGPPGVKVDAEVIAVEPQAGGTRTRVRYEDPNGLLQEVVVGPVLELDPRRVGDVVVLFIEPATGRIVREPEPAVGDGTRRRELYGKEPGRLGRLFGR